MLRINYNFILLDNIVKESLLRDSNKSEGCIGKQLIGSQIDKEGIIKLLSSHDNLQICHFANIFHKL